MIKIEDVRWGKYLATSGPWHPGTAKFKLPDNPTLSEKRLAIVNATEGGSYDAVNGYDRCIMSAGLIQECEAGIFRLSALLGELSRLYPFDAFMAWLHSQGLDFHPNANGKYRFYIHDEEVDTTDEQQRLFRLDSDGSGWDKDSIAYAKRWVVELSNLLSHPDCIDSQAHKVAGSLRGFMMPDARKYFSNPPVESDEESNVYEAGLAAFLSFAANLPKVANDQLLKFLATTDSKAYDMQWLQGLLAQLTFGPEIAIYPGRYNAIRKPLETLFSIDLPDFAEYLPILPKGIHPKVEMEYDSLNTTRGVQLALLGLGYDIGPYGVDSRYGKKTKDAVIQFQYRHHLTVDGIVGPQTKLKLMKELSKQLLTRSPEIGVCKINTLLFTIHAVDFGKVP